jgi:hypothetical protein
MCSRKVRVGQGAGATGAATPAGEATATVRGAAQAATGAATPAGEATATVRGAAQAARLEVTCHPEATTFRDEGGRLNYLVLFVVLRVGHVAPARVAEAVRLGSKAALEVTLEYESGERVFSSDGGPVVEVLGRAGELSSKIQPQEALFCFKEGHGSMRYRVLKLSRSCDMRKFRVRVALKGFPEVGAALSRATTVLSKRKWLLSAARTEEAKVRHQVEAQAEWESVVLAEAARGAAARANTAADLRELCARPALETSYPELQSLGGHLYGEHESDGSRTEAPGGAGGSVGEGVECEGEGEGDNGDNGEDLPNEGQDEAELDETFDSIDDDDDDLTEGGVESAPGADKRGTRRGRPSDLDDAMQAALKRMHCELDGLHKRVELMEAADKSKTECIDTLVRELQSQRRWNDGNLLMAALHQPPAMLSLTRGQSLASNPGFAFGLLDGLTRSNSLNHSLVDDTQSTQSQ